MFYSTAVARSIGTVGLKGTMLSSDRLGKQSENSKLDSSRL